MCNARIVSCAAPDGWVSPRRFSGRREGRNGKRNLSFPAQRWHPPHSPTQTRLSKLNCRLKRRTESGSPAEARIGSRVLGFCIILRRKAWVLVCAARMRQSQVTLGLHSVWNAFSQGYPKRPAENRLSPNWPFRKLCNGCHRFILSVSTGARMHRGKGLPGGVEKLANCLATGGELEVLCVGMAFAHINFHSGQVARRIFAVAASVHAPVFCRSVVSSANQPIGISW